MNQAPSTDKHAVLLENELLTNEVRSLRARLSEAEERASATTQQLKQQPSTKKDAEPSARERRIRELEAQALDDMHWLVNRLDSSPIGPFIRSRAGFRTLKERYGEDPRA